MGINYLALDANLVADPEIKVVGNGVTLAKVRLASNRRFKRKNGEWDSEVLFLEGTIWDSGAEYFGKHFQKGDSVHVTGELRMDTWEQEDGQKREKITMRIGNFHKIERVKNGNGNGSGERENSPTIESEEVPF